jgi:NAD(P)-dependent dehydrogenase (short-subunit alcohol dehydrogenase family)
VTSRKAIFITGGASGIGRAVAQHFAAQGWFVGLADLNEAGMAETAALLPSGQSAIYRLDVRNRDDWRAALEVFWATSGGRLDTLFNNAGVARGGLFSAVSPEDHDLLIDVNFKGVVHGAEAGFAYLKQTPGSCLLNTSSAAGLYGAAGLATYAATKFAVRGLTEALDLEWAPHGIKVRSLMPGFIDTPLLDITTSGTNRSARQGVQQAGLEFTPVEKVAEAAWDAVHGTRLHHPIGPTAKRLAFMSRFAPSYLRRMLGKNGDSAV